MDILLCLLSVSLSVLCMSGTEVCFYLAHVSHAVDDLTKPNLIPVS